jgi:uncharacterized protein with HEPN domain
MSRDLVYAADILVAARKILSFVENVSEGDFLTNELVQSAVLHQLTVIGEVAKRVSDAFRAAHPSVAWPSIAGLRNRIVHEYDDIDLDIVWQTVQDDIPALKSALELIVPEEPHGEE